MNSVTVAEQVQDWRPTLALYYPRVRAWFAHVLGDRAAVEDLSQEVFVRLCERLDGGEVMLDPWSYIKTIARNVFMEHLRAQIRQKSIHPLDEADTGSAPVEPTETCARMEATEAVPELLADLSATQRCVVVGRYFLDMTVRELAKSIGTSASTVVEQHHRAICRLRKLALDRGIDL